MDWVIVTGVTAGCGIALIAWWALDSLRSDGPPPTVEATTPPADGLSPQTVTTLPTQADRCELGDAHDRALSCELSSCRSL